MKVNINVPNGKSGIWSVESFTVSEDAAKFESMRSIFSGGRSVPAGDYKRLSRSGKCIMSNTPDEIRDLYPFYWTAKDNILINALGLGVALKMILQKPEVISVTVIEKSQDVINLCAPTYLEDKRVTIICDDAFTYKPPKNVHYDCVWHDIWDDICSDNLKEMEKLHRKYAKRTEWQGSWCKEQCKRLKSREF